MIIPRGVTDAYGAEQAQLMRAAREEIAAAAEMLDWNVDYEGLQKNRDAMEQVMLDAVARYGDAAAANAAEFFESAKEAFSGKFEAARITSSFDAEQVRKTVHFAAESLFQKGGEVDAGSFVSRLQNAAVRMVNKQAMDTMTGNGGDNIEYCRVTGGDNVCPLCEELESRGYVWDYDDLVQPHDGCMCTLVPGFGDNPSLSGRREETWEIDYGGESYPEAVTKIAAKMMGNGLPNTSAFEAATAYNNAIISGFGPRVQAAEVFGKSIEDARFVLKVNADTSRYLPGTDEIELNQTGFFRSRTVIHEVMHRADSNAASRNLYMSLSSNIESHTLRSIVRDGKKNSSALEELMLSLGAINESEIGKLAENMIRRAGLTPMDSMSIRDIINALTRGRVRCIFGHEKDYWDSDSVIVELIADYGSSAIANEVEFNLIRELMPNLSLQLDKVIGAINGSL